jgi:predicted GH43/DUF377 family glycosyl hydrolase
MPDCATHRRWRRVGRWARMSVDAMGDLFVRCPANPLLTAADWPYPGNTVFNPATAVVGETVLLRGVEDRRGLSHLTVARSADGVGDWRIDEKPFIVGDPADDASR